MPFPIKPSFVALKKASQWVNIAKEQQVLLTSLASSNPNVESAWISSFFSAASAAIFSPRCLVGTVLNITNFRGIPPSNTGRVEFFDHRHRETAVEIPTAPTLTYVPPGFRYFGLCSDTSCDPPISRIILKFICWLWCSVRNVWSGLFARYSIAWWIVGLLVQIEIA